MFEQARPFHRHVPYREPLMGSTVRERKLTFSQSIHIDVELVSQVLEMEKNDQRPKSRRKQHHKLGNERDQGCKGKTTATICPAS